MGKKTKAAEPALDMLGSIEHLVLNAVTKLGDNAYGMSIFEYIRERYPAISFGSVYTSLERMTWKGYVEGEVGEPEQTRGGRARKYYHVTGLGRKVLQATRAALFEADDVIPNPTPKPIR